MPPLCTYFKLVNCKCGFSKFKWIHLPCMQKTCLESWVQIFFIFLSHCTCPIPQHTAVTCIWMNTWHSLCPPTQEGYAKSITHIKSGGRSSCKRSIFLLYIPHFLNICGFIFFISVFLCFILCNFFMQMSRSLISLTVTNLKFKFIVLFLYKLFYFSILKFLI